MSLNNLSYAVIGVLLGLLVLALGQLVDCQNLAGATMALQCPNGNPVSKLWLIASIVIAGSGIAAWLFRNRNFQARCDISIALQSAERNLTKHAYVFSITNCSAYRQVTERIKEASPFMRSSVHLVTFTAIQQTYNPYSLSHRPQITFAFFAKVLAHFDDVIPNFSPPLLTQTNLSLHLCAELAYTCTLKYFYLYLY